MRVSLSTERSSTSEDRRQIEEELRAIEEEGRRNRQSVSWQEPELSEQEKWDIETIARELDEIRDLEFIEQEYRSKQSESERKAFDLHSSAEEELNEEERKREEAAEIRKQVDSVSPSVERPPWIEDARKRKVLSFLKSQAKQEELEEFAQQNIEVPREKKRPKRIHEKASSSAGPASSSADPAPTQEPASSSSGPAPKQEIKFEESQDAVVRETPLPSKEELHGKISKNRKPGDELTLVEKWGSLKVVLDDSDF